ncbi:translocation/assembly module TamB domain-containing protein [Tateyamaria sp.]|uniref:translocation/assembly module TamB domain-containing protein n=1 Tax=Tateyamaria sp. TaxID=1929288 RepID=UPI00329EE1BD
MRYILALALCLMLPFAAHAQDDDEDRGVIAGLLENALGGDGRTVRINGFSGALSSTARITQITIADSEGIWLTLDDVALTWNRGALLRGAIDVELLRAARIDLPRLPMTEPGIDVPDAEATPFSLPDLPASLQLGALSIDVVALGAPILGEAVEMSLTGAATLADGAGDANLVAKRIDGTRARFTVNASYANDTRALSLDLDVSEDENGLLSGLIDVPGRPSLDLKVQGEGLLSDFAATLDLRTDDAPRLAGTLALQSEEDGPLAFDADLAGDVTALFLPQYAAFFGPDVKLNAQGNQDENGAVTLEQFALDTRALRLNGQAALNRDGWPTLLDIQGQISDPDGGPVLLPAGGDETRIDQADLVVSYDADQGDALMASVAILGLDQTDVQARSMTLGVDGTLMGEVNSIGELAARVDLNATGLDFTDPAIARAVGSVISGGLNVTYGDDAPLQLENLSLTGTAGTLVGNVEVQSLSEDFATTFDVNIDTPDLSAFADLAGLGLTGAGDIAASGSAALGGFFELSLTGTTQDLAIGIAQADAVLAGETAVNLAARRDETGTFVDRLTLNNPALSADIAAQLQTGASQARFDLSLDDASRVVDTLAGPLTLNGTAQQVGEIWDVAAHAAGPLDATADFTANIDGDKIDIDLNADVPDLNPIVPQITGGAQFTARAAQRDGAWTFDSDIQGPFSSTVTASGRFADAALNAQYTAVLPSLDPIVKGIPGALTLNGDVAQLPNGWQFATTLSGPYAAQVNADGRLIDGVLAANYAARLPDVSNVVPGIAGAATVGGRVQQVPNGWEFTTAASGPYNADVTADGRYIDGALNADYAANLPDVSSLAPGINGAASLTGNVQQEGDGWRFANDINGPYSSTATVSGTYLASRLATAFQLAVPNVAPLVPGVSGPLAINGTLAQIDQGWQVATDLNGPYSSTGTISGTFGDIGNTANYALRMPNIGALVPRLSGVATVNGTATQVARGFDIEANLNGPSGTTAQVQGLVGTSGRLELDATGQAQLGLINPFISPRSIAGLAGFDLTIDGPAALSSVRGRITTQGTRVVTPNLPITLGDLSGAVDLNGERATLDFSGQFTDGGAVQVSGPLTLAGNFPAQLAIALDNVVVSDKVLYTSLLNGGVTLNGPLTGGARIAGTINVGETNVQVPNSTVSTLGAIPDITHIGETRPQMSTRRRAGLIKEAATESSGTSTPFPLDVTINAPSRIFIRGRGLDAELGGTLRITGSTADTISTGQIDLIRGRLNILTKRFDLTEGRVQLQGRFEPIVRFVAATTTTIGTAEIVVDGPVADPTVSFESSPEAPQDQVLAQIFFGRDISQLSAFQALQLANAVAQLAGRGGEGLVSQLRGSFGLDDLDVTTSEDGSAALRAGKYLSDNVYTDVTVGAENGAEVSLNIDLTPNVTVRGSVSADSNTGVGIFIEKDY